MPLRAGLRAVPPRVACVWRAIAWAEKEETPPAVPGLSAPFWAHAHCVCVRTVETLFMRTALGLTLLVAQRQGRVRGRVGSEALLEQKLCRLLDPRLQRAVRVAVQLIARSLAPEAHADLAARLERREQDLLARPGPAREGN
eukprot:COSAG06_NODE_23_length_33072_cov_44.622327_14_plen_142_part_00